MTDSIDPKLVLQHQGWLRLLAIELLGDTHRADDIVQEAWVAALQSPPRALTSGQGLGAWLSCVVRNLARMSMRAEARREARESLVAKPSETDPSEVSDGLDGLRTAIVQAVDCLDSRHRQVVVMRYFEGLSPREIASRLGEPGGTIRSRLKRALQELRHRLDRSHDGKREAWLTALVPLAGRTLAESTESLWGAIQITEVSIFMKSKMISFSAACLMLLIGAYTWIWSTSIPEPVADAQASHLIRINSADRVRTELPASAPERAEIVSEAQAMTSRPSLHGRVETPDRIAVANARILFAPGQSEGQCLNVNPELLEAQTGADGRFEIPLPDRVGRLSIQHAAYVTAFGWMLGDATRARDPVIIAALKSHYAGVVVDGDGNPLQAASIRVVAPASILRALRPGVAYLAPDWRATTNANGEFSLADVGWCQGVTLRVECANCERREIEVCAGDNLGMIIELRRITADQGDVVGQVIAPGNDPIAGASVFLGRQSTKTDHDGKFIITSDDDATELLVAKSGFLPVRRSLASLSGNPVTVELKDVALTIEGCIVDADGQPIAGARVWTRDSTKAQATGSRSIALENVIGERGDSSGSSRSRTTDAQGQFRIFGLLPTDYLVRAVHPQSLEVVSAGKVAAGTVGLRLVLGSAKPRRVSGRVLSLAGKPIAGAEIAGRRKWELDGIPYRSPFVASLTQKTDSAGWFDIPMLCVDGVELLIAGEGFGVAHCELDSQMDLAHVKIRCPLQCSFQLVLAEPSEADGFRVLDTKGETQGCWVDIDGSQGVVHRKNLIRLANGRSAVTRTLEHARWIVLIAEGKAVRRTSIELVPGTTQVIRL